jgi:hypothetical protein
MNDIPAFPSKGGMVFYVPSDLTEQAKTEVEKLKLDTDGMTLRDYFAAKVLQSYESRKDLDDLKVIDKAKRSYHIADAMMKARSE